jgi:hypothetical protein
MYKQVHICPKVGLANAIFNLGLFMFLELLLIKILWVSISTDYGA